MVDETRIRRCTLERKEHAKQWIEADRSAPKKTNQEEKVDINVKHSLIHSYAKSRQNPSEFALNRFACVSDVGLSIKLFSGNVRYRACDVSMHMSDV
ncbi:hypothetical protein Trydic_g5917 [Trypoxylus dichotomus]